MTPTDLAAALLRDLPRLVFTNYGQPERFIKEADVLAALTTALHGVDERAGGVQAQANQMIDFLSGQDTLDGMWFGDPDEKGHRFWWRKHLSLFEAMDDLITALLAQIAALRAERDALIEWNGQASVRAESAEDRAEAAEAKRDALEWFAEVSAEQAMNAKARAALTAEADNG